MNDLDKKHCIVIHADFSKMPFKTRRSQTVCFGSVINCFLTAMRCHSGMFIVKQDASFSVISWTSSFPMFTLQELVFLHCVNSGVSSLHLVWIGIPLSGILFYAGIRFGVGVLACTAKKYLLNVHQELSKSDFCFSFFFFLTTTMLNKKLKPKGSAIDPAEQCQSGMCCSIKIELFSRDWVAGAVQRPLNFTREISNMHLITSVLFSCLKKNGDSDFALLFKSLRDLNFQISK